MQESAPSLHSTAIRILACEITSAFAEWPHTRCSLVCNDSDLSFKAKLLFVILHPDGVDLVLLIPCRVAGLSENLFVIGNDDDDMLKSGGGEGVRVGAT